MPDEQYDPAVEEYRLFLDERKLLIDAARESARSFAQAALAFGAAVFGASIAFIKDVAPRPEPFTPKWLGSAWLLFTFGLLAIMLAFLFSHRACMFEIDVGALALGKQDFKRPKNKWSTATNWSNGLCVAFLFLGLVSWSVFALENIAESGGIMSNNPPMPNQPGTGDKQTTYVPPRTPPPPPPKPQK
jgi:hypothetical protein